MSGAQSVDLIESDGLLKVQFLEDNTINIVDSKAHKILSFSSRKEVSQV